MSLRSGLLGAVMIASVALAPAARAATLTFDLDFTDGSGDSVAGSFTLDSAASPFLSLAGNRSFFALGSPNITFAGSLFSAYSVSNYEYAQVANLGRSVFYFTDDANDYFAIVFNQAFTDQDVVQVSIDPGAVSASWNQTTGLSSGSTLDYVDFTGTITESGQPVPEPFMLGVIGFAVSGLAAARRWARRATA